MYLKCIDQRCLLTFQGFKKVTCLYANENVIFFHFIDWVDMPQFLNL